MLVDKKIQMISKGITQIVKDESDNTPPDYQDTKYKIFY